MRVGEYRSFGSFPVILTAPGTAVDVQFSGPAKTFFNVTTEEDVYSSPWTLVTVYQTVQNILASINMTGPQYRQYQMLMVLYDWSGVSFYGLYGCTLPPPTENINPFPVTPNVAVTPDTQFQCLYVRGDKPVNIAGLPQSGSLLDY